MPYMVTCHNCGKEFDMNDVEIYWEEGPYVDCPHCGYLNDVRDLMKKRKEGE